MGSTVAKARQVVGNASSNNLQSAEATASRSSKLHRREWGITPRSAPGHDTKAGTATKPPVAVRARHILVKTEEEAMQVTGRVEAGEAFDAIAEEVSVCPSRTDGGHLGWLRRGTVTKEFQDAAFLPKPADGRMQIVESKHGWHVLVVDQVDTGPDRVDEISSTVPSETLNLLSSAVKSHAWPEALAPGALNPELKRKIPGTIGTSQPVTVTSQTGRLKLPEIMRFLSDVHDHAEEHVLERLAEKFGLSLSQATSLVKYVDSYVLRSDLPIAKMGLGNIKQEVINHVALSRQAAVKWDEEHIMTAPMMQAARETIEERQREELAKNARLTE